jgi:hypothetical protein
MAEAMSQTSYETLNEFLDSLPTKPCPSTPGNRYFCTVCERLNKSIAARCSYSNIETTGEVKEGGTSTQFIPLSAETETQLGDTSKDASEKVEFKIVTPKKIDKDFPLFEIVQPKDKKVKPIEMELLEDVAIEFEPTSDEPVEVEALEVTPLEESDEDAEVTEVMEVDVVEADLASEDIESGQTYPEFIPVQPQPPTEKIKPGTQRSPKRITKKVAKKTIKKGSIKKPVKTGKKQVKKGPRKIPKKAAPKLDVPPGQATWEPPRQIPKQSQPQPKKRIQPVQPYPTKIPTTKTPKTTSQPTLAPKQPVSRIPTKTPTLATATKTPKKVTVRKKVPKVKQ